MIRFAVCLFFFVHLAILMKFPALKWAGRVLGGGLAVLFFTLFALQVEENSDYAFVLMGFLAGVSVIGAEIVARLFRK